MSDFNSPRRLFELWKKLTGEELMPDETHENPGKEVEK